MLEMKGMYNKYFIFNPSYFVTFEKLLKWVLSPVPSKKSS